MLVVGCINFLIFHRRLPKNEKEKILKPIRQVDLQFNICYANSSKILILCYES